MLPFYGKMGTTAMVIAMSLPYFLLSVAGGNISGREFRGNGDISIRWICMVLSCEFRRNLLSGP